MAAVARGGRSANTLPRPRRGLRTGYAVTVRASAVLGLLACSGGRDGSGPGQAARCAAVNSIEVGTGTTPLVSWQPACNVGELWVAPDQDFAMPVWVVRVSDLDALTSPIQYGVVPPDGFEPFTNNPEFGEPLQAGTRYRVILRTAAGAPALDSAVFTP